MPAHKVQRLQEALCALGECLFVPVKQIASIVGNIMSMSIALGPLTQLMIKSLHTILNGRHFWYERLQVSPEAAEEFQFWH